MRGNETYTVYRTKNLLNGHIYVGVHKSVNPYDGYLGSGILLKYAIKKYGVENFSKEILFEFDDIREAYKKENEIVNLDFVKREDTYNIVIGGSISPDHLPNRIYPAGEKHHQWGKKASVESNVKRSVTLKITNQKEEVKKRRSEGAKIANESMKRNGHIVWNKGKNLSEKDKLKKSESAKRKAKVSCPHCGGTMDPGNAKKYHFEKCASNKNIPES
jgi:hypothetical protein